MSFAARYRYTWPDFDLSERAAWRPVDDGSAFVREMPESTDELLRDSRWPAFFPSPMCFVTTSGREGVALEKVVGASIVNRFPYVVALSFCSQNLSRRHHARSSFCGLLEEGGAVAVQFLSPGNATNAAMREIGAIPDRNTTRRIRATGLSTRTAMTNDSPVFDDAYLIYEARLVEPRSDFEGRPINASPWRDIGSHRVYFLEIQAIQLREDIAQGRTQIRWRSLPVWKPGQREATAQTPIATSLDDGRYVKTYTPNYAFPSSGTIAFEADGHHNGMAVKRLPPLPEDQVEVDDDRARWPCFFPSSAGMITTWREPGVPNVMPCGSTTIVSRNPLVITPCVSYAAINVRYAPRASLGIIRETRRFGCGVPFIDDSVIKGLTFSGNVSLGRYPDKVARSGLAVQEDEWSPVLSELPIHYHCEVVDEIPLGTHVMFLGEVKRIRVRSDVTTDNPVEWIPWADLRPASD